MPINASMAALVAGLLVPPVSVPPAATRLEAPARLETAITVEAPRKLAQTRMWLYSGYAALQVGDIVSTTVNLNTGASEKNVLLTGLASSPMKLTLVKAVTTSATLWAVETLWKSGERKGAIGTLAVATAIAAVVFAKNLHTYSQLQNIK